MQKNKYGFINFLNEQSQDGWQVHKDSPGIIEEITEYLKFEF